MTRGWKERSWKGTGWRAGAAALAMLAAAGPARADLGQVFEPMTLEEGADLAPAITALGNYVAATPPARRGALMLVLTINAARRDIAAQAALRADLRAALKEEMPDLLIIERFNRLADVFDGASATLSWLDGNGAAAQTCPWSVQMTADAGKNSLEGADGALLDTGGRAMAVLPGASIAHAYVVVEGEDGLTISTNGAMVEPKAGTRLHLFKSPRPVAELTDGDTITIEEIADILPEIQPRNVTRGVGSVMFPPPPPGHPNRPRAPGGGAFQGAYCWVDISGLSG